MGEEEIMMKEKQVLQGVPGILRPFKTYIEQCGMKPGDQIVYYGVPGTCTPFVELLGFAIRDLHVEQVFVPYLDESKARRTMPNVPVTADQMQHSISRYASVRKIGVCFMQMFEKAGWLDVITFDLLIDARIDPVDVWQQ
jgi:hypothetical protein